MTRGRVAFIPLRYGPEVVGGSEAVVAEAAHGLAGRGWKVDILTSQIRDLYTLDKHYREGKSRDGSLTVRRFPHVKSRNRKIRDAIDLRIIDGDRLSRDEQLQWLGYWFRIPDLFSHLLEQGSQYDAIIVSPYLYWMSVTSAMALPEKTIVMPCLHDEPAADLDIFREMLEGAASAWFLSEPERELAERLGAMPKHHLVTGAGVTVPPAGDPDRFRRKFGIEGPFVLYAGRREAGKRWPQLHGAFVRAVRDEGIELKLVTFGSNPLQIPGDMADIIFDLGFLDTGELPDAYAAASAMVQPSRNESFSRTIMESWLQGTLVIADAYSEVVNWHCRRSGAGLVYRDDEELIESLRFVAECPERASALARPGRDYVLDNYAWEVVLGRMESGIEAIK